MPIKKIIFNAILTIEIISFIALYVGGKNGLHVLQAQYTALDKLSNTISAIEGEIQALEKEIVEWNSNDFYKEKIAREKLQMARKTDKLFYIG